MTTVAIMQPTYLPWIGYFDLIDQADTFVLLDTVAISRQSWQTRNRIRDRSGNVVWLSVPTRSHIGQPINEVEIAKEHGWQQKHRRTLKAAYGHAPYWDFARTAAHGAHMLEWERLADLTGSTILGAAMTLRIRTKLVRASELRPQRPGRTERLADILHQTRATEFLQTFGGAENLAYANHIEDIPIRYHDYQHPEYDQGGAEFMSHLSVIDLLAWHGPKSLQIIRSGRRTLETAEV